MCTAPYTRDTVHFVFLTSKILLQEQQHISNVARGALSLHPPTNRPHDIPTHMKCPQNILSAGTKLLLCHYDPATIFRPKVEGLFFHLKKWMV
jgi:hypothetical protein